MLSISALFLSVFGAEPLFLYGPKPKLPINLPTEEAVNKLKDEITVNTWLLNYRNQSKQAVLEALSGVPNFTNAMQQYAHKRINKLWPAEDLRERITRHEYNEYEARRHIIGNEKEARQALLPEKLKKANDWAIAKDWVSRQAAGEIEMLDRLENLKDTDELTSIQKAYARSMVEDSVFGKYAT